MKYDFTILDLKATPVTATVFVYDDKDMIIARDNVVVTGNVEDDLIVIKNKADALLSQYNADKAKEAESAVLEDARKNIFADLLAESAQKKELK